MICNNSEINNIELNIISTSNNINLLNSNLNNDNINNDNLINDIESSNNNLTNDIESLNNNLTNDIESLNNEEIEFLKKNNITCEKIIKVFFFVTKISLIIYYITLILTILLKLIYCLYTWNINNGKWTDYYSYVVISNYVFFIGVYLIFIFNIIKNGLPYK